MPGGKTHDTLTILAALGSVVAAEYLGYGHETAGILAASVAFSGLMFSPDLDLPSAPLRRWGPLRILWIPYERILPHRSPFSHWPILGTISRLLYFAAMASLLVIVGGFVIDLAITVLPLLLARLFTSLMRGIDLWWSVCLTIDRAAGEHPMEVVAAMIGLEVGAAAHYCADYPVSWIKGRRSAS